MTPIEANFGLQFMDRVPLKGSEVRAFMVLITHLQGIASGELHVQSISKVEGQDGGGQSQVSGDSGSGDNAD